MIEKMTKYGWIVPASMKHRFFEDLRELRVIDISRSSKPVDEKSESFIVVIQELRHEIFCIEKGSDENIARIEGEVKSLAAEAENCRPWGSFDKKKLLGCGLPIGFHCIPEKKFDPAWENDYALVVVSRQDGKVWFVSIGATDFPAPRCAEPSRSYDEVLAELESKRSALDAARKALSDRSSEIPSLRAEIARLESDFNAYLAGLQTETVAEGALCVFEGFAPTSMDESLRAHFDSVEGIYWTAGAASLDDNPPIKLKNNTFVRQFEVLTDMYGVPNYGEFDPTVFLSIFFLLFFAMCMGDMGYGLLLIAVGLALKGKKGGLADLWSLIVTLGAGTVIVGFFFGTFFGIEIPALSWLSGDISFGSFTCAKQMALSLLIGVIHLTLALTVKAVWSIKNRSHEKKKKKKKKKNVFIALGGFLWGLYQFVSGIIGDILSYIRLYALGLSGYMLGATFNKIALMVRGDDPTWQWVPFILIVLIGHALNLAMSCLGAFVHPLRLNFVEFFKNSGYNGNGKKYNPINK